MKNTKEIVLSGLFLSLGVIFPTIFHYTGIPGTIFLPMHFPVLTGGFFLRPAYSGFIGAVIPLLNFLISAMPPMPMALAFSFELAVYGFAASCLRKYSRLHNVLVLFFAMVLGRIGLGIGVLIISGFLHLPLKPIAVIQGSVVTGLPGILLQLILIPIFVGAIKNHEKGK
jgi:hypothetical protein